MSGLIWLPKAQMRRIEPCFPLSHGVPRVDDRRVISGIIFVIRNGLRWREAPREYGPHKTICNRFVRWSRMGVFRLRRISRAWLPSAAGPLDLAAIRNMLPSWVATLPIAAAAAFTIGWLI